MKFSVQNQAKAISVGGSYNRQKSCEQHEVQCTTLVEKVPYTPPKVENLASVYTKI